ncbi:uncharacterized protein LOC6555686 [Drosophila erecta]|uniref:Uncharacterized protein n=1 Tax=Drosophila erecta TaxID=7220 RepID=B3P9L9_DROER|nr:uncharacterized protein LOC6555686 [Drosophila erecta]EDV45515.1 uncharacterized protein Dere_GG12681 [Drosophila erecta]
MKPKTEKNLQTSIWINKKFESSLLSSSKPVQSGWGDFLAVAEPQVPAKPSRKRKMAAMCSRLSGSDRATEELARQFASMTVKPENAVASNANEPYFASNLKYYPHLIQPTRVGHYQTYAEIKELWLKGNYSQLGTPIPPMARPGRDNSMQHDVPDEPPKPAPNRRYSVNRRKPTQRHPKVQHPMPMQMQHVQSLKEESGSNKPTTATSKGAIPKQPKFFLTYTISED